LCSSFVVLATIAALFSSSGCAAWRATTHVPVYEHTRRARANIPTSREVYRLRGYRSIFTTLESPVLYYEEISLPVRLEQRSGSHWFLVGPAWLVENVYVIAASPVLYFMGLIAGDVWYETDKEPSIDMEVTHFTEWGWWFFTRPVYLFDFLLYDVPTVLFVFPYNVVFHWGEEPNWKERWSPEAEDGRRRRGAPESDWDSFSGSGQL
jgi:hypothetical protein